MYRFGRASFTTFLYLREGEPFSNVDLVEVEMENAGAFHLIVADLSGNRLSQGTRENSGWNVFNFRSGMNPPVVHGMSPYKLKLLNVGSHVRHVKGGSVQP